MNTFLQSQFKADKNNHISLKKKIKKYTTVFIQKFVHVFNFDFCYHIYI